MDADADAMLALGMRLYHGGDLVAAEGCLRRAIALRPESADAHLLLGMLCLLTGRMEEGWAEHEWRLRCREYQLVADVIRREMWRESIEQTAAAGRTVLVRGELGLGDNLQFLRFVPMLLERRVRMMMVIHPPLVRLVRQSFPDVAVFTAEQPVPPHDGLIPMMSLGWKFAVTMRTIPTEVPYLRADRQDVANWRGRLAGDGPGFRIGVVWAGSPHNHLDGQRSCRLTDLSPLWQTPGARFYSLQKGPGAAQLAAAQSRTEQWGNAPSADAGGRPPLIDHTAHLTDMADTAALIECLDLVIAVDTSVGHLAGAMGKPVYTLLSHQADWRYHLDPSLSPWYPTMRLFRQSSPGDWRGAVGELAGAVAMLVRR